MKQIAKNNLDGQLKLIEISQPLASAGQLLVRNHFSLISTGTELSNIKIGKQNLIQKALSRPEELKKVINLSKKEGILTAYNKARSNLERPNSIGYSSSGVVISVGDGVKGFKIGDPVACGGSGHAEIISVPEKLCTKLPENVSLDEASFITVASIAMEGLRKSGASLGENVAVIGLGLIGQITLELLKAAGANPIGIDLNKERVIFAKRQGFTSFIRRNDKINRLISDLTSGVGVDSVIITANTKSSDPIKLAGELAREKAIITILGGVGLNLSRKQFYDKDLTYNIARSYGPGRYDSKYENDGHDYPVGYVRWTENRNMQAIAKMLSNKKVSFKKYISHKFPLDKFEEAYENSKNEKNFGILFQYNSESIIEDNNIIYKDKIKSFNNNNNNNNNKIGLGLIGTGNFAQNVFLPLASKNLDLSFRGVCSSDGLNPDYLADKFRFDYSTTDPSKIFSDSDINVVFVLTRNDSHSKMVINALKENKHVFVEKPLCIKREEIFDIIDAWTESTGSLMVGYNRRFSTHITKLKTLLSNRTSPVNLTYRINSKKLPPSHWASDDSVSGGRMIAEMCHFVDLSNFIISSKISSTKSEMLGEAHLDKRMEDTFSSIIKYADGSLANLVYSSEGNSNFPKEIIEVHCQGEIFEIKDFNELVIYNKSGINRYKTKTQDKGAKAQIKIYSDFLKGKSDIPIDFKDLIFASETTFNLLDSSKNNE